MEISWHCTTQQQGNGLGVPKDIADEPHVPEESVAGLDFKMRKSGFAAMEKSSRFMPATKDLEL